LGCGKDKRDFNSSAWEANGSLYATRHVGERAKINKKREEKQIIAFIELSKPVLWMIISGLPAAR
jgi:hypothetical protein